MASKYKCPFCGEWEFGVRSGTNRHGKRYHQCKACGRQAYVTPADVETKNKHPIKPPENVSCKCGATMRYSHQFETEKGHLRFKFVCKCGKQTNVDQSGKVPPRGVWRNHDPKCPACGSADFAPIHAHKGVKGIDCKQCGSRWSMDVYTGEMRPRLTREEEFARRSGVSVETRAKAKAAKEEKAKAKAEADRIKAEKLAERRAKAADKPAPKIAAPRPAPAPKQKLPARRGTISNAGRLQDLLEARRLNQLEQDYLA